MAAGRRPNSWYSVPNTERTTFNRCAHMHCTLYILLHTHLILTIDLRPGVLVTSTGYISSTSVARQVVSLTLGRFHDADEPMLLCTMRWTQSKSTQYNVGNFWMIYSTDLDEDEASGLGSLRLGPGV